MFEQLSCNVFCKGVFVRIRLRKAHTRIMKGNMFLLSANRGPGGSMSQVVGLPSNSYKPITNTAWVRARLYELQKGCTRLAGDKVYQLLADGRWFSPGTQAFYTTITGRHDIAEILLKVALKRQKIKSNQSIKRFKYLCEQ